MAQLSPPQSVHAVDIDALCKPGITLWTLWSGNVESGGFSGNPKSTLERHVEHVAA